MSNEIDMSAPKGQESQTTPAIDSLSVFGGPQTSFGTNTDTTRSQSSEKNFTASDDDRKDSSNEQSGGILDWILGKPKTQEPEKSDWVKTLNANDEKTKDLSTKWLDLAKQGDDPASKRRADAVLTELADHLVSHMAIAPEKQPSKMTLSANRGFTPAFTKAIEADTKDLTAVKALTDRYNERAKAADLPGRVDLKITEHKDGNRTVDLKSYDSRFAKDKSPISNLNVHYRLTPRDK